MPHGDADCGTGEFFGVPTPPNIPSAHDLGGWCAVGSASAFEDDVGEEIAVP
jgi:hypothetical protein